MFPSNFNLKISELLENKFISRFVWEWDALEGLKLKWYGWKFKLEISEAEGLFLLSDGFLCLINTKCWTSRFCSNLQLFSNTRELLCVCFENSVFTNWLLSKAVSRLLRAYLPMANRHTGDCAREEFPLRDFDYLAIASVHRFCLQHLSTVSAHIVRPLA